jgi:hypothetical protein
MTRRNDTSIEYWKVRGNRRERREAARKAAASAATTTSPIAPLPVVGPVASPVDVPAVESTSTESTSIVEDDYTTIQIDDEQPEPDQGTALPQVDDEPGPVHEPLSDNEDQPAAKRQRNDPDERLDTTMGSAQDYTDAEDQILEANRLTKERRLLGNAMFDDKPQSVKYLRMQAILHHRDAGLKELAAEGLRSSKDPNHYHPNGEGEKPCIGKSRCFALKKTKPFTHKGYTYTMEIERYLAIYKLPLDQLWKGTACRLGTNLALYDVSARCCVFQGINYCVEIEHLNLELKKFNCIRATHHDGSFGCYGPIHCIGEHVQLRQQTAKDRELEHLSEPRVGRKAAEEVANDQARAAAATVGRHRRTALPLKCVHCFKHKQRYCYRDQGPDQPCRECRYQEVPCVDRQRKNARRPAPRS